MLPIQSFLKKTYTLQDIDTFLDQYPNPAFLWNENQGKIITCNAKFIILSGYTRKEISTLSIRDFLPELGALEEENELNLANIHFAHNVKSRAKIKIVPLHQSEDQYFVTIGVEKETEKFNTNLEHAWDAIHQLLTAPIKANLSEALRTALESGQTLTGATLLGVYLPIPGSNTKLVLIQSFGDVHFLPKIIDKKEIKHLQIPVIWQLGTRASSVLHQKALAAQFAYLATNPLDPNAPNSGLVVVADPKSKPPQNLLKLLNVLSRSIKTSFQLYSMIDGTRKQLNETNIQLEIFQEIKDQITDGIIFVDQDRNIIDINNSACLTLGYFELEVIKQPLEKVLVCDCGISEILDAIKDDISTVHEIGEISIQQRNGKTIPVHLRAVPLSLEEDAPAIAILLSDLSTIKEMEARSKQLETHASIGEMIAVFAHEVRNPINNIRMGIENFNTYLEEPDGIEEEIDRLLGDVDRISELMKSILSAYRTKEYKIESINLEIMLQNILFRWQPRMSRYGIQSKLVNSDEQAYVKGDKRSLEQVFTNIIQNGINAMQETGGTLSIKVSIDKSPKMVQVDIGDTGPGIPEEIKDKIFNLYFSTRQNGNGIGLAITKQIVDAHNGQISVNSVPGGTVFTVSLPKDETH